MSREMCFTDENVKGDSACVRIALSILLPQEQPSLQAKKDTCMDPRELLKSRVVVEGHRDVYEQLYRKSLGEEAPVRDAIAPRLIRDGINVCVYAISGDSYSHTANTGRYLETALE